MFQNECLDILILAYFEDKERTFFYILFITLWYQINVHVRL